MSDRLFRSPTDRVISGVAGGLAVWLNLDPSLVRIAWVLLAIASGGVFVLVYIVMMIVVPLPPAGWIPRPRDAAVPPGGAPQWTTTPGEPPQWTTPPTPAANQAWGNVPAIVIGILLIVLGAWFLVERYISVDWGLVWPFVVIALGALMIVTAAARGRRPG